MTEVRGACRAGTRNDMAMLGMMLGKIPTFSKTIRVEGWTSGDRGISAPPRCSLSNDGRRGGGLCIHQRRYRQDQDIEHRPALTIVRKERREVVNEFRNYLHFKVNEGYHSNFPSSRQTTFQHSTCNSTPGTTHNVSETTQHNVTTKR